MPVRWLLLTIRIVHNRLVNLSVCLSVSPNVTLPCIVYTRKVRPHVRSLSLYTRIRTCDSGYWIHCDVSHVIVRYSSWRRFDDDGCTGECSPGWNSSVFCRVKFTVNLATILYCAEKTCLFDGYAQCYCHERKWKQEWKLGTIFRKKSN